MNNYHYELLVTYILSNFWQFMCDVSNSLKKNNSCLNTSVCKPIIFHYNFVYNFQPFIKKCVNTHIMLKCKFREMKVKCFTMTWYKKYCIHTQKDKCQILPYTKQSYYISGNEQSVFNKCKRYTKFVLHVCGKIQHDEQSGNSQTWNIKRTSWYCIRCVLQFSVLSSVW